MPIQGTPDISSASTHTLSAASSIYIYNGVAAATWTLPTVSGNSGEMLILYNRGTGVVTVQRAGSDQINNQGSLVNSMTLAPNSSLQMINDGSVWIPISGDSPLPLFDNVALGANHQASGNIGSGNPYTWLHTVAVGNPYGLVGVWCQGTIDPSTVTFSVTFGGITLQLLAYGYNSGVGSLVVFGGNAIPSGSQTVSVTMTKSGTSFPVVGASFTYTNVAAAVSAMFSTGDPSGRAESDQVIVPRQSSLPGRSWLGVVATQNNNIKVGITQRIHFDSGYLTAGWAGDIGVSGPEDIQQQVSMGASGFNFDALVALDLLGRTPTNPYLDAVGGPGLGGGGASHTFISRARNGAYVLVAFMYLKASGGSLSAVTYGGAAMTQLGTVFLNNDTTGATGQLYLYGLANVAGGFQTVSITTSGANPVNLIANAVSYLGVNTVGTVLSNTGSSGTLSHGPITIPPGQLVFQCFGDQRDIISPVGNASNLSVVGPVPGQAGSIALNQSVQPTTTFSASSGTAWASLLVPLS